MPDLKHYLDLHYKVELEWEEDTWIARNPELHGCIADGRTEVEAIESLRICRRLWIESRLATGKSAPEPGCV